MKKEIEARLGHMQHRIDSGLAELRKEINQKTVVIIHGTLRKFNCAECGMPFLINEGQYAGRKEKERVFYCSAGHKNYFT